MVTKGVVAFLFLFNERNLLWFVGLPRYKSMEVGKVCAVPLYCSSEMNHDILGVCRNMLVRSGQMCFSGTLGR